VTQPTNRMPLGFEAQIKKPDFEAQVTKPKMSILRYKLKNLSHRF
jgi:hypothetical protein